ncbi:L-lactate dehydrogenase (cytochrome) [Arenibacter palladensis]|uniref:L-lactate dehydrogenase (Cytochrome) n=1 Tax=Arenibacter palladensis TaxID=237373 RepID=A0A1M4T8Y0_9FLAO|nr:alpha-hydroxy acid oxidase [Arenibacter palladensis]SHE40885.1 L-lactate dehydrogenase (cytochrome) [Arenibacter palladensis]|tara:strand:- start:2346 stop:3503 length:1158 start_codon:yes stop_codon:yes gene_type:complete
MEKKKEIKINSKYPSVVDLRKRAQKRIPKFAFEYLDGGCNEDVNLHKNTAEIRDIELLPYYLSKHTGSSMKTELFGHVYDAPFGIAPVGLQGLMWPNAPEILAKSAFEHNIPFILSTVTTSSIERISEITEGKAWFQLYHPTEDAVRDDIIKRAEAAECPVLVILCDVPTFGFRPRDVRNGLAMPPKMSVKNILQILGKPNWAMQTLIHGQPNFETLKPYMPKGLDLAQLGKFMDKTFSGRLNEEKIKPIRDMWKGKLVIKGVANEADAESAIKLGLDGIIVSNHGGRQLDAGESTIKPLTRIAAKYGDQIKVMMDSGLRGGPDIARTMASGAEFTFMGRSFMYGVAALGAKGGDHTISLLKTELQQVMEQICCEEVKDFPNHLI